MNLKARKCLRTQTMTWQQTSEMQGLLNICALQRKPQCYVDLTSSLVRVTFGMPDGTLDLFVLFLSRHRQEK